MLQRMLKSAHDLVEAVGISGPGEPGKIAEMDAWRYVVKTMREMRHGIALGGQVDLAKLAEEVGEHLGVTDLAPIAAAFAEEKKAFEDHFIAETEKHGSNSHFHEDHGVMNGAKLPRKLNEHTGKPEGDERESPKSHVLNHAAFAKVRADKGLK